MVGLYPRDTKVEIVLKSKVHYCSHYINRIRTLGLATLPTMASGVDAKLLKSTKFPAEFNQKVDMQKVNVEVMKKYRSPTTAHFAHFPT